MVKERETDLSAVAIMSFMKYCLSDGSEEPEYKKVQRSCSSLENSFSSSSRDS